MTSVFYQLLRTEAFVDVTLTCNENSLKAHKVSFTIHLCNVVHSVYATDDFLPDSLLRGTILDNFVWYLGCPIGMFILFSKIING